MKTVAVDEIAAVNELYEFCFPAVKTVKVDGLSIPFDETWDKILVSVSGGADSAMLCHTLASIIEERSLSTEIHVSSNIRMWKLRPWQRYDSLRVFQYLEDKFKTIKFVRHENFVPPELEWGNKGPTIDHNGEQISGDILELRAFNEYVCSMNGIKAYYGAVTHNPYGTSFDGHMPERNLNPAAFRYRSMVNLVENKAGVAFALHPFRFIDKSWVMRQYKRLDLSDLLNRTRSCEGDTSQYPEIFKGLDYSTYVPNQEVPECGRCFWCLERNWAIEK